MNKKDFKKAIAFLTADKHLGALVNKIKIEFPDSGLNTYEYLVRAIMSQQLSTRAAATIYQRFMDGHKGKHPAPKQLIKADDTKLRSFGLSGQKASYLKNIATFALENSLETEALAGMTDEEIIANLTTIKGVGKWTVEMMLMFHLKRPDVFPIDDLGIQQGMIKLFNLKSFGKELKKDMLARSLKWKPYRTVACLYLWQWKDEKSG